VPIERIESPGDPRVSAYLHMADRELLVTRGLFVAEGRLVVQRVIESGRFSVQSVLLSDAASEALSADLARLSPDAHVYVCPADLFQDLTGYHIHRGCLALVARPAAASMIEVIKDARLVVVLDAVTDPDNVGGVFRNAAAFGADAVLLSPTTCDPLYRKAIRTSMAATLAVPFARLADWPADLNGLKDRGFTIAALTPHEPAEALDVFAARPRQDRLALLVGTEGSGLSAQAVAHADVRVRIPMRPGVDSLNLAVAAGIALSWLSGREGRP